MTPSIDQTLHQFANLLPNWTFLPISTLLPNCLGFHRRLQRMRLANRGRLLLWTPGPIPFWTCICSNVETILSWTCYVYGPFEIRTSLGTSFLLVNIKNKTKTAGVHEHLDNSRIWYSIDVTKCIWLYYDAYWTKRYATRWYSFLLSSMHWNSHLKMKS